MSDAPRVTIALPTFNAAADLDRCLTSIFSQDYPPEAIEVLVIDGGSTDRTMAIAAQYPVTVIPNPARDAQVGKILAYRRSTAPYFTYIDADLVWRTPQWLRQMLAPLEQDATLAGSGTRAYIHPGDPPLNRYLTFDPLQRDPLYQFFSVSAESTVIAHTPHYDVCEFDRARIPTILCLYRRAVLESIGLAAQPKFMELDVLATLVRAGHRRFAYVPQAGYYHRHITTLRQLVRKRLRNIDHNYLPHVAERTYTWFSHDDPRDLVKILGWIVYAHLGVPALVTGCWKAIRHRDWAGLYEPIVVPLVTDTVLWGFLRRPEGRRLGWRMIARA